MTISCSSKLIIPILSGSLLLLANSTAKATDAYLSYDYSGAAGASPSGGSLFSSPGYVEIYSNQTQFLADSASDSATGDLPYITEPGYVGPTTSTQSATAAIQGSFNFNYLSARVSSSAARTVGRYTWSSTDPNIQGQPQEAYNVYTAGGSAGVSQAFSDQLTIVSTGLQIGAPVELVVDWSLDALLSITGAQSDAHGIASITMDVGTLLGGAPRQQLDYWNNGAEAHSSGSFTVETNVGQVIPFFAQLYALSSINSFGTNLVTSSFADATANFALRVITPGAGYSAASGNVYATSLTAVPLPSAVWLFASGLLGLFGLKRQRQA